MKIGDTIKCSNAEDVRKTLEALELSEIRGTAEGTTVTVTSVPETSYLVQFWSDTDTQFRHCATLEEAEQLASEALAGDYKYAEIAKGYAGEWMPIRQVRRDA